MTEMEEQIGTRRLTVELENLRNNIGSEFLLAKLKKATALCLTAPPGSISAIIDTEPDCTLSPIRLQQSGCTTQFRNQNP